MNNKFIITFIVLLLILPSVLAQVKVQLGEPYVNIKDFSEIRFTAHSDYYEICSLDKTIIPILIKNRNNFTDTFEFEVNKEYASLPVKGTVLKSGKSAILPLIISSPIDLEENTTLILDIITKKEGLKRSLIIKTNIKRCYLFDLKIDRDKDEICGCDKEEYSLLLRNNGRYKDIFTLKLEIPEWINSTLTNETIELYDGQKKEVILEANPPCEEKGIFTISAKVTSEKTKVALEDKLELTVLPQKECYNTVISADNVDIDYFGKNIPITIKNKGLKDATYSLTVEGIEWYTLSQTDFSLKQNKEKTINLALYPDKNVVAGDYNIDIKTKANGQEFTKSITVRLKSKSAVFEKIKFYLNYFRYYIGSGIVLLVIILLLIVLVKKRIKEKGEKRKEKVEKEKKVKEKRIVEEVKKEKRRFRRLFSLILYLVLLALLVLITYSTFKYRTYYEKVSDFISGLFASYIVPYASYLRYVIVGIGALIVLLLVIDFFRKKGVRKERKEIRKEEPKEKKVKIGKISRKTIKRRKFNFKYIYISLAILLLLAIAVYAVYKFSSKLISVSSKTWGRIQALGKFLMNLIKGYYPYFIIAVILLVLLVLVIKFIKKIKKIKRRFKKFFKILISIIVGLIVLSGIIYSFVYYNLLAYIKGFFIVYYPYILMGIGILAILILILHFYSEKIQ